MKNLYWFYKYFNFWWITTINFSQKNTIVTTAVLSSFAVIFFSLTLQRCDKIQYPEISLLAVLPNRRPVLIWTGWLVLVSRVVALFINDLASISRRASPSDKHPSETMTSTDMEFCRACHLLFLQCKCWYLIGTYTQNTDHRRQSLRPKECTHMYLDPTCIHVTQTRNTMN